MFEPRQAPDDRVASAFQAAVVDILAAGAVPVSTPDPGAPTLAAGAFVRDTVTGQVLKVIHAESLSVTSRNSPA